MTRPVSAPGAAQAARLEVPETSELSRVRDVLEQLATDSETVGSEGLSPRQIAYALQTARCLGLVDSKNAVTRSGARLVESPRGSDLERSILRETIDQSRLVQELLPNLLNSPNRDEIAAILERDPRTRLAAATAQKRAAAISQWRTQLIKEPSAAPPTTSPMIPRSSIKSSPTTAVKTERLLLVHLSDLHIKAPKKSDNALLARGAALANAIAARVEAPSVITCLVVVTGDITFASTDEENEVAGAFLDGVMTAVRERTGVAPVLHVLPGNHDCDFSKPNTVRDVLLNALEKSDDGIVSACLTVQSGFSRLANKYSVGCDQENLLAQRRKFSCGSHHIELISYNSAWCSQYHEQQGALHFPSEFLVNSSPEASLVLTAFHHPYAWLGPHTQRTFRDHVEQSSDVILTGHEHVPGRYQKIHESGEHNEYIEGGVLQQTDDPTISEFNVLCVDFTNRTQQTTVMTWVESTQMYDVKASFPAREFRRSQHATRMQFELSQSFLKFVRDPGESYKHPKKVELNLGDIYIDPYIKPSAVLSAVRTEAKGALKTPTDLLLEKSRILICGAELTGKTALAKMLFTHLHNTGIVPVYLTGKDIVESTETAIGEAIRKAFEACYSGELFERWRQLAPQQRAVIIDDMHSSALSVESKDQAVGLLEQFAAQICVLANDDFAVVLFDALKSGNSRLLSYDSYSIEELGSRLRYELVEKWCFIGNRATDDRDELMRRAQQLDSVITKVVGTNLLPSYPALILLCLQQLEAQSNSGHTTMGSFGHLYEALIVQNLHDGVSKNRTSIDLDGKRTFLAHFAFTLFLRQTDSVSLHDWEQVYESYATHHDVSYPRQQFLDEIRNSNIVLSASDGIRFKYPSGYCFFVGEYLSHHLDDSGAQETIADLCRRLNHNDSANIVLFLAHLCRDPRVLETLLGQASQLFPSSVVPDMQTALAPLGSSSYITQLRLGSGSLEARRREDRDERDRLASLQKDESGAQFPEMAEYAAAQRTVQIMGQVLRSYPGSLVAEQKLQILKEAYALGMRAAGALIGIIVKEHQELADEIAKVVVRQRPELANDLQKVRTEVRTFLSRVCEALYYGAVLHVSDSVGLPALRKTYDKVIKEEPVVAYRLIDLAIKLDHFDSFPDSETTALERALANRTASWTVLRRLVWRHLYLFPVEYRRRQQLCQRFEILATPLLLNSLGGQKKKTLTVVPGERRKRSRTRRKSKK